MNTILFLAFAPVLLSHMLNQYTYIYIYGVYALMCFFMYLFCVRFFFSSCALCTFEGKIEHVFVCMRRERDQVIKYIVSSVRYSFLIFFVHILTWQIFDVVCNFINIMKMSWTVDRYLLYVDLCVSTHKIFFFLLLFLFVFSHSFDGIHYNKINVCVCACVHECEIYDEFRKLFQLSLDFSVCY